MIDHENAISTRSTPSCFDGILPFVRSVTTIDSSATATSDTDVWVFSVVNVVEPYLSSTGRTIPTVATFQNNATMWLGFKGQ